MYKMLWHCVKNHLNFLIQFKNCCANKIHILKILWIAVIEIKSCDSGKHSNKPLQNQGIS